jgi:uncharacterized Zn finger protein
MSIPIPAGFILRDTDLDTPFQCDSCLSTDVRVVRHTKYELHLQCNNCLNENYAEVPHEPYDKVV